MICFFFSPFFQIYFCFYVQLVANIAWTLKSRALMLSPQGREQAGESHRCLRGNILQWEGWLLSFLRTLKNPQILLIKVKAGEGLRFVHKLGWKNSWESFQGWKFSNFPFPYPQKVRKLSGPWIILWPYSQTLPKSDYLPGHPFCIAVQLPHPHPGLQRVLMGSRRPAFWLPSLLHRLWGASACCQCGQVRTHFPKSLPWGWGQFSRLGEKDYRSEAGSTPVLGECPASWCGLPSKGRFPWDVSKFLLFVQLIWIPLR